jgi:hypothetical protein
VTTALVGRLRRHALGAIGAGIIVLCLRSTIDPTPPNGRLSAVVDGLVGAYLTYALARAAVTGNYQPLLPHDDDE